MNGLSYFCGRFIAAPAMTVFIFLSIPASGAAFPEWFMPEPFRWLNNLVVGSGITEMLKRLVYDVGPGYARGWMMLGCYAVIGLLLTLVGKPYWERQRVRRMLRGKTTMMQDAQRASGRQHEKDRETILGDFGLEATTSGIIMQRNPAVPASETPPSGSPARGQLDTTSMWALGGPLEQDLGETQEPPERR
ncbi:ABC transporter permease [Kocuria coralli]|uniref:ABC transporter permease n=1 Tax=Kocuria coralli TaxID=1461025 RepID=A0A5J5KTW5_9MICC|nr:ABC transporter permease [Kocuria coralli]KAA9393227.1 ABC transporter permease [Kocuria coralli]